MWRRLENKTCALRSHANQQTGDIVETSNLIGEIRIELANQNFIGKLSILSGEVRINLNW